MRKALWSGAVIAAALLAGCSREEPMPVYPYDLPRANDKDVVDVDLVGSELGHSIDARMPPDNAAFTIHLADIMAPAKGQPWHSEAVAALDALVKGKRARIRVYQSLLPPEDIRRADGTPLNVTAIAHVFVDGRNLSWELVGSGNAWVWEAKSNDPELKKLQEWARRHKKGLWALPESDRVPPWQFIEARMRQHMQQREESAPK
jgi:endonuclease YncB( thermonuclease family)